MLSDTEILAQLEDATVDATRHQLQALRSILDNNSCTRYLQQYLKDYPVPADAETFRRLVPLSSYEDYTDHIRQMADGDLDCEDDRPVLSVDPLACFFYSSGTSSMKPKLIPYFDSAPSKAVTLLAQRSSSAMLRRLFPPRPSRNKCLWFMYAGNVTETKSGYKIMAASAFPFHSRNSYVSRFLFLHLSPKEVILSSNVNQQMYCHLLCGLRLYNLVDGIRASYAAALVSAISLFESKWEQLCYDLEIGYVSLDSCDDSVRDSVNKVLSGPQADLANRVRSVCEGRNWEGILSKLWPHARYVKCVTTGSMEQYYPKIKYYAGNLTVLGGDYVASECCVAMNMDILQPPENTKFTLLPNAAYFEFLPFDINTMSFSYDETVDIAGVKIGKMYEVTVTTYRGLYRYRLGDIVEIVGFHNSSPQLKFVTRAPKFPNEILTERELLLAMSSFQKELGNELAGEITDFACYLDLDQMPRKLNIYIEVIEGSLFLNMEFSMKVLGKYGACFQDGLGTMYKHMRGKNDVDPISFRIVKYGSFDKILEMAIENGAQASQYKPPKIIRNMKIVEILEKSTVAFVCLD